MAKKHTWLCLQLLALLITLAGCTADEQLKETQIQRDRGLFVDNAYSKTTEEDIEWEKTFGGNKRDYGHSVQQTSDGGYIIVENTHFARGGDVYLIKTDSKGGKLWEKNFGGSGDNSGYSVQQTSDDGYVITGSTFSDEARDSDVYLIKTDSDGGKMWEKKFGGGWNDHGHSVQQTSDGGYIIAGNTLESLEAGKSDVYLIKTDSDGGKLWEKNFGGSGNDYGHSVQQTSDGGYIIAGSTSSYEAKKNDVYLIKTDSDGGKLWEKNFGGGGNDSGHSVHPTSDGGYIITGGTYSYGAGMCDVYLIKTDSDGEKLWEKTFGGSDSDKSSSVRQTSDGGYIITGGTYSYGAGMCDVYLIKTDSDGGKLWEKTFGGNNSDVGSSVRQMSDGGYIIVGSTSSYGARGSNVYLIKTNFISQDQVSTPAFKPPRGLFEESVDVDIACDTHDATIRYTTDGSTPSSSVGVIYDGTPIHLTKTTTIKAIAFKDGMMDSVRPLKLYEKKKY